MGYRYELPELTPVRWARDVARLVGPGLPGSDHRHAPGLLAVSSSPRSPGWPGPTPRRPPAAAVAISLAGSLFFDISPEAARGKVALYLLLTMAPFAIVAPILGPALDSMRAGGG